MPNLKDVAENPDALRASVDAMMNYRGSRGEVRLNHGVRTTEELDALVRKTLAEGAHGDDVDVEAYRRLMELAGE